MARRPGAVGTHGGQVHWAGVRSVYGSECAARRCRDASQQVGHQMRSLSALCHYGPAHDLLELPDCHQVLIATTVPAILSDYVS